MERWNFLPGKDGLQIPGDGAVLQNEAGDADAAVFPDVGVDRAVLPQGQIGLQVGQAGGEIFEVDLRTRFAEPVQGIQGIGARWLPITATFMGIGSLRVGGLSQPRQGSWMWAFFSACRRATHRGGARMMATAPLKRDAGIFRGRAAAAVAAVSPPISSPS